MNLKLIRSKVRKQLYDLSSHAHQERQEEQITVEEIEEVLLNGSIIEKYLKDPRGESCLVAGKDGDRYLHVVCGLRNGRLLVVTVYKPKLPTWQDWRTREKELKSRV